MGIIKQNIKMRGQQKTVVVSKQMKLIITGRKRAKKTKIFLLRRLWAFLQKLNVSLFTLLIVIGQFQGNDADSRIQLSVYSGTVTE